MYIALTDDHGKAVLVSIDGNALFKDGGTGVDILHESGKTIHVVDTISDVINRIEQAGMRVVGHEKFTGEIESGEEDN